MKKLFFFGDSICYGHMISINKTWVNKISERLNNYIVNNPSRNGDTSLLALQRLHHDVIDFKPDYVYIQFGLNDCNKWETMNGMPRVSLKSFDANINEICMTCLYNDIEPILATNHICSKNPIHTEDASVYNCVIRNNNYSRIIDIEKYWKFDNKEEYLMNDGVHLSEKGHEKYFQIVYPLLKNIIT